MDLRIFLDTIPKYHAEPLRGIEYSWGHTMGEYHGMALGAQK